MSRTQTKYSPDSSTKMHRSHHEMNAESTDTIRHIRRKEEEHGATRPAPPPYIGQAIPRVKPIRTFQKNSNNSVGESSRPTSRRFDTFGENALETIYDQFKFLDESEEPSQSPTSVNSARPIMAGVKKRRERRPSMVLYCVLPLLELIAAVAIIVTSFLANRKDLESKQSSSELSDTSLASEAVRSLSIQNSLSTVIPATFQIVSSIFGFFPIYPQNLRRSAQLLHIFFNSILIVLWLNAIYDLFFKVSMEHILKPGNDEKYVIDLILGCFIYFATVVLPAITLSVAAFSVSSRLRKIQKSLTAISLSLGVLIFSLATLVIAIFMAQGNLAGSDKNLSDNSTMFAYGLKESIVFVFILLISVFSLIVATQNSRPLMVAAAIGQGISIMSITSELYTSERISAIFAELKTFETSGSTTEIGIVLLNGCSVVSLVLLVVQLIVFVFCVSTLSPIGSAHSLLIDNNRNPSGVERTAF